MYKILARNGEDTFTLHDLTTSDCVALSASSTFELNKTGSLSMTLAPTHPHYNDIVKMKTEIIIEQDGEWLWSGRVLDDETGLDKIKKMTVEGELAYLLDSNQRIGEYHDISVSDFFEMIIEKHNADVDEDKQFAVGVVNVVDSNDSLYRYANYENTWDYINDKLISRLGGYIKTRHEDGVRYIDYVTDYGDISTQEINFGKNLVDLTQTVSGEDIATVIIPLGAKIDDDSNTDKRLTIEGAVVNGEYYNKDYIVDEEAAAIYGKIVKVVEFDDITVADNLYQKGLQALSEQRLLTMTLELTAIDLHLLNTDTQAFKLGDNVRVMSPAHGVDTYLKVAKLEIDYNSAANFKLTLGETRTALTEDIQSNTEHTVEEIKRVEDETKSEIQTLKTQTSEFMTSINQKVDSIESSVSESTDISSLLEDIQRDFESTVTQTAQEITMNFSSQIQSVRGEVYENTGLIEEYIRFKGAMIELGRIGSNLTTQLSNEELAFYEYGNKIAYINRTKMYIVQSEISKLLTLGSNATGKYDFIAKSNGNLTFKWRAVMQ